MLELVGNDPFLLQYVEWVLLIDKESTQEKTINEKLESNNKKMYGRRIYYKNM